MMIFLDAAFSPITIAAGLAALLLPVIAGVLILCAAIAFIIVFVQKKKNAQPTAGAAPAASEKTEPTAAEEAPENETPKNE